MNQHAWVVYSVDESLEDFGEDMTQIREVHSDRESARAAAFELFKKLSVEDLEVVTDEDLNPSFLKRMWDASAGSDDGCIGEDTLYVFFKKVPVIQK